eukprot:SAG22_NODE_361_length_11712_cov_6.108155_2_plen_383_part_00
MARRPRNPSAEMRAKGRSEDQDEGEEDSTWVEDDEEWDQDYPELMFVPIKLTEPTVPALQFLIYLVMLTIFMFVINSQHLHEDYKANQGVQQGVRLTKFNKISTVQDYHQWWPELMEGFNQWSHADYRKAHVILLGPPEITQYREQVQGSSSGNVLDDVAELLEVPAGEHWVDPYNGSYPELAGCACKNSDACYRVDMPEDGYSLGQAANLTDLIADNSPWSPECWVDSHTHKVSHKFTVYITASKRLAQCTLNVSVEPTGNLLLRSAFDNYEPFQRMHEPISFWTEMIFYFFVVYFLMQEFIEIWDCIALSQYLVPQLICLKTMELQLYQIQYLHESTSEVYDPRDKKTGRPFKFPDTADLKDHYENKVLPANQKLETRES